MAKMTPVQFARAECANHQHQGFCYRAEEDCVLLKQVPERCAYFEKCVLPLADKGLVASPSYQYARTRYLTQHGAGVKNGRK